MEEQDEWEAACRADAQITPAEWERMIEEAEPYLIALEMARDEAEGDALYVTYREASRRTGLSVGTIRERVRRDGVEVIGSGGTHRVRWGALREALQVRPAYHREPVGDRPAVTRVPRQATRRFKEMAKDTGRAA